MGTLMEPLPRSLTVVAALFIFDGALAVLEIVLALLGGRIDLNFGVLGIPIGWGLLHLSSGWRSLALLFLGIAVVGIPIIALLFLGAGPVTFSLFGFAAGNAPKELALAVAALAALSAWQLWVLTRPDIRALFEAARQD